MANLWMVYLLKMVIFHGKLLNNQMVIIIRIRSVGISNEPPLLGSKNGRLMEKMIWDFGVAWKKLRQTQGDKILIGGLEHEFYDFPFSWELSSSQLTFTPSFFSRIDTGNIPWGHGISVSGHGSMGPGHGYNQSLMGAAMGAWKNHGTLPWSAIRHCKPPWFTLR